ncbi:Alpha/Beta hydrolase protein [Calycina marina]|uniref:Alpha/Beta hydrolase protein n=1 Tax=Calycina marina TaxID=1763456 RepID=A0A9P7YUW0_9HELO|nr:Alpha/Beta hydrolase protein [Calycina marina]
MSKMQSVLGHSEACCNIPPIISKGYKEKGTFETINGLKYYVTGSPDAKKAIIFVYDIFGYFPQTLQGADILASSPEGYQVLIPDFFEGEPANIAWYPPETDDQKAKLGGWFPSHGPPTGVAKIPKVLEDVQETYGKKTFGAVGFCWGGKVVSVTSGEDTPWKAVASTSPSMMDPEDAAKITIPTMCLPSMGEKPEMVDPWKKALKVDNFVERFDDQLHGWMSARADLEDERVKEEYKRGYRLFLEWFAKHL